MVNTSSPQFVAKVRKYVLWNFGNNVLRFGRNIDLGVINGLDDTPGKVIRELIWEGVIGDPRSWQDVMQSWGFTGPNDADRLPAIVSKVAMELYREYRTKDPYQNKGNDIIYAYDEYPKVIKRDAVRILSRKKSLKRVNIFSTANALKPKATVTKTAKGYLYEDASTRKYLNEDGSIIKGGS